MAIPVRDESSHKWQVGGVVIIGGAPGYIGAPALSARSAGRAGAGIVSIAAPRSAVGAIATLVPEATFVPLPEGDARSSAAKGVEAIRERVARSRAIVVGPGLSQDEHATALMSALFGTLRSRSGQMAGFGVAAFAAASEPNGGLIGGEIPAVVDADGLNWLAQEPTWWERVQPRTLVLTPHTGEMARLLDIAVEDIRKDPAAAAIEGAARWNQYVLLKGPRAIITDGETTLIGPVTPVSLATAGSGDVLAGALGAFLAQGLSPMDAAALAVVAGADAAKLLEAEYGPNGVIASDLPDALARSIRALSSAS
jgi:ADP-dependent NAD(P)H-hydrate dehydratase / NAD(P)H-hydrate epimerase